MQSEDCIVIRDKISKLNIYGRLWHRIHSNSSGVKRGTRMVKGINKSSHRVNGYNVNEALRRLYYRCRSDGAYTSPHSGRNVKESWHLGCECNIECDASHELEAWYESRRNGGMQRDPSPGRGAVSDFPSEGTRFRQSHQGRQKHLAVPDGNSVCCWCFSQTALLLFEALLDLPPALPDLLPVLPDLSPVLPGWWPALTGFSPALPGPPRCS
jgi:hypothetical protein